jgi:hypothetical protein
MSTLANITSLNLSLQTGGAALAVNAVKSVAKPARTVYVFGTADDVAPNFTTVAGAITYANSLTPIVTEPVVVRLFTKANGEPYDLAGLSSWTTYANSYIYFVSDFVRLNETTTLPTTLPEGLTVWYRDGNDVEYLYVGNADGDAQEVAGPRAYELILNLWYNDGDEVYEFVVLKNTYPNGTDVSVAEGLGVGYCDISISEGLFTSGQTQISARFISDEPSLANGGIADYAFIRVDNQNYTVVGTFVTIVDGGLSTTTPSGNGAIFGANGTTSYTAVQIVTKIP